MTYEEIMTDIRLYNYRTNEFLRRATLEEYNRCIETARFDGGAGVFLVDGIPCYVQGEPDTTEATETTETAANDAASACGDPDCTDGVVDGGEYLSHAGDIGNYFYDCPVCRPGAVDEIPDIDEAMEYVGF